MGSHALTKSFNLLLSSSVELLRRLLFGDCSGSRPSATKTTLAGLGRICQSAVIVKKVIVGVHACHWVGQRDQKLGVRGEFPEDLGRWHGAGRGRTSIRSLQRPPAVKNTPLSHKTTS